MSELLGRYYFDILNKHPERLRERVQVLRENNIDSKKIEERLPATIQMPLKNKDQHEEEKSKPVNDNENQANETFAQKLSNLNKNHPALNQINNMLEEQLKSLPKKSPNPPFLVKIQALVRVEVANTLRKGVRGITAYLLEKNKWAIFPKIEEAVDNLGEHLPPYQSEAIIREVAEANSRKLNTITPTKSLQWLLELKESPVKYSNDEAIIALLATLKPILRKNITPDEAKILLQHSAQKVIEEQFDFNHNDHLKKLEDRVAVIRECDILQDHDIKATLNKALEEAPADDSREEKDEEEDENNENLAKGMIAEKITTLCKEYNYSKKIGQVDTRLKEAINKQKNKDKDSPVYAFLDKLRTILTEEMKGNPQKLILPIKNKMLA